MHIVCSKCCHPEKLNHQHRNSPTFFHTAIFQHQPKQQVRKTYCSPTYHSTVFGPFHDNCKSAQHHQYQINAQNQGKSIGNPVSAARNNQHIAKNVKGYEIHQQGLSNKQAAKLVNKNIAKKNTNNQNVNALLCNCMFFGQKSLKSLQNRQKQNQLKSLSDNYNRYISKHRKYIELSSNIIYPQDYEYEDSKAETQFQQQPYIYCKQQNYMSIDKRCCGCISANSPGIKQTDLVLLHQNTKEQEMKVSNQKQVREVNINCTDKKLQQKQCQSKTTKSLIKTHHQQNQLNNRQKKPGLDLNSHDMVKILKSGQGLKKNKSINCYKNYSNKCIQTSQNNYNYKLTSKNNRWIKNTETVKRNKPVFACLK